MPLALVVMLLLQAPAPSGAPTHVRATAYARIGLAQRVAADPELVQAVQAKNAGPESSQEIQKKDHEWIANPQYPLRRTLTQSACANRLRSFVKDDPIIVEAFLSDARGALVCATTETSDYWQGDEPKWQKTFVGGTQALVEEPALDASTSTYAVQLSVLVTQAERRLGVLTLTLKIPKELAGAAK